jgi:GNAT superfamily N-acetyltransferase
MIGVDKNLSQLLERTEARANADFVETRRRLDPDCGSEWTDIDGTYAMYDGAESPLTQTFGLGMFVDADEAILDRIEAFFSNRNAPVMHEVSPIAEPGHLSLLGGRGYRPVELSTVLFRELDHDDPIPSPDGRIITTRIVSKDEADAWAETSANGWSSVGAELAAFVLEFGRVAAQCRGSFPYLAEIDGQPAGTGSLLIYDDICIAAGASTVPEFRNRGVQNALLADRLNFAADLGCRFAMMAAAPGSQSQKNAQRNGFHIAYTRTKWQLFR